MGFRETAFAFKSSYLKRSAGALYEELLRNQHLTVQELESITRTRAHAMARFAFSETEFYRGRYREAGLTARDLGDPGVFETLPIIDRSTVKGNSDQFRSTEATPKNTRLALTGGSTGEPLKTVNDARVPGLALSWRMHSWWGVAPSDNVAHIGRWVGGRRDRLRADLLWWPTKLIFLEAGNLDRPSVERFLSEVNKYRPTLVEGYVGAMREIAEFVTRSGTSFHAPKAIGVTAAPLTPSVRRQIESTLGAPVYDQYRSSEVQWMAGECREQNGLHVFSDMRKIEIVDPSGRLLPPGEVGDIVVTDLANRVFPIIRYKLGDRGSMRMGSCPCGISLPLIDPPDGRTVDMIRLPDGTVIAGGLFAIFSARPDSVRLFQLHQNADYSIMLRVVLGPSPSAMQEVAEVAEALRNRFKRLVPVEVVFVDALPYTKGKIKYITSDVPDPST